jgi:hypothetical protein
MWFVCCASLLITACGGSLDPENSGYVTMMPYTNENMGIRGVVPLNWNESNAGDFQRNESPLDATTLILTKVSDMTVEETKVLAATQLFIDELPESLGTYTSPSLTWDLYEFESMMDGQITLMFKLALASYGDDVYIVVVAGLESDFVKDDPLHETVYIHAVHGLSPLSSN